MSYSPQERQKVVDAHLKNTYLSCGELAKVIGCGKNTARVILIAFYRGDETLGARTAGDRAKRRDAILALHKEHPEYNCNQIAMILGMAYVEVQRVLTSIGEYKRVYKPYKKQLKREV